MPDTILYEVDGRIATVTLNRPERLNAISPQMIHELIEALEEAERDERVHVAVVQGAGRAFSVGYDIATGGESDRMTSVAQDRDRLEDIVRHWLRITELRLPVIAKVHGYCIAGASQLASICDVTIAAEDTKVGWGAQLPLGAGYITTFWSWFVGPKKAKELAFTVGELITGREAAELGLFNRAVPAAQLDDAVRDYARKAAKTPKDVLALQKVAVTRSQEMQGFRQALMFGAEINAIGHDAPSVVAMRGRIKSQGLRAAIESWKAEDW